jgi:hypothetical protein
MQFVRLAAGLGGVSAVTVILLLIQLQFDGQATLGA